uniref:Uncharacterized protein n=1 Tax=Siphoviridae sp. ctBCr48 TaxID=2827802 RepID=A0A8S5SH49_9CAUD|nr:MAG TPA: hypothetical protein [Siphoviridae sp. ctBCr48]
MRISAKDESDYIDTYATIEKQFKDVTKQEFDEFIASYPRHLERDVCGICEPPAVSYNDWEIGWWSRSVVANTMLYSDDPKESYYEPEDKRVYRIVTNYEDLHKESQMLLEKYRREQFRKGLKDKFIDSDEDDYEVWLEEQCRAYTEKISQMEGEQNQLATSLKVLIDGYAAMIKGMIFKEETKEQKDVLRLNAYKDCLIWFENLFKVSK